LVDKSTSPLFSIIIPCYNQAHFLPECLDSILIQKYKNWEALIINDGATDNTSKVASQYQQKDNRIRLIEKVNGGLSSARNKGIQEAKGNYFIFLDADDLILNDCLQYYASILTDKINFIQSGYLCFKKSKDDILFKRNKIPQYVNFLESVMNSNIGPVNGFVISSEIINSVGLFNELRTSCEDWDYWIRCAKSGFSPLVVNELFAAYRFVPGSMGKNSLIMLEEGLFVINYHHLKVDSKLIITERLNNDSDYRRVSLSYLIFSCGIALFNNQSEAIKLIKKDYLEILKTKIDFEFFSKISNYQTFRNYNVFRYTFFYFKSSNKYDAFFYYLLENDLVSKNDFTKLKKYLLPNPFFSVITKVLKRIEL